MATQNDGSLATRQRRAKEAGGSEGCIDVNITEIGREVHDVKPGDLMQIEVYDDRIEIRKHPLNDPDRGRDQGGE